MPSAAFRSGARRPLSHITLLTKHALSTAPAPEAFGSAPHGSTPPLPAHSAAPTRPTDAVAGSSIFSRVCCHSIGSAPSRSCTEKGTFALRFGSWGVPAARRGCEVCLLSPTAAAAPGAFGLRGDAPAFCFATAMCGQQATEIPWRNSEDCAQHGMARGAIGSGITGTLCAASCRWTHLYRRVSVSEEMVGARWDGIRDSCGELALPS